MPWKILCGDALTLLKTLPDESVQCCVTSPPYWGLRNYNVEGQLGQENTPEEYTTNLVAVFHEVKRLLRKDGVVFCNLGDCSAAVGKSGGGRQGKQWKTAGAAYIGPKGGKWRPAPLGLKPWRVAFALQNDGWYLRSDIIWAKNSVMPESVRDRPTRSHEYVFLLTKSPRYFYDADAIREPLTMKPQRRLKQRSSVRDDAMRADRKCLYEISNEPIQQGNPAGSNKRDVWVINPKPFRGAHFATMPVELALTCVKAGTS
jgi:DNA modification methylase